MTFEEYAQQAITTDTFNGKKITTVTDAAMVSKILGLAGEAGEVAEKFKKIVRDRGAVLQEGDVAEIQKELGDVLWYINALCFYMGITLEETAQKNLDKVLGRKDRGVTKGSGDNR